MKEFNNGFTTVEQSNRLLELGVPTNTADLQMPHIEYYDISPSDGEKIIVSDELLSPIFWDESQHGILPKEKFEWEREFAGEKYDGHFTEYIPCWTAGRLIEIIKTCRVRKSRSWDLFYSDKPLIEQLITIIETCDMDFSKLKDYE